MAVGKTSLLRRLDGERFRDDYAVSPGVELVVRNGKHFWAMAGLERYAALNEFYLRDFDVCLAVFDLTRPETLQTALNRTARFPREKVILVGNKRDVPRTDRVRALLEANRSGLIFATVSAKTGEGVRDLLTAASLIKNF